METEVLSSREFFSANYASAEDRRRVVLRAPRIRSGVLAALEAQNARWTNAPRERHLRDLRDGAACVVTGQQMGLFLGPLYTIYKAASAIRIAEALSKETGRPVVPIFWMQTEDHDLPEIACCAWPSQSGGPTRVTVPSSPEERISIAHRKLPREIADCTQRLRGELEGLPHAAVHLERVERHYREGRFYAEAFADLLTDLLQTVLIFDPRHPQERSTAVVAGGVHRRAIYEAEKISGVLEERVQALKAAGFAAPVHIRPGAPLSFFHPQGAEGPRYRLEPREGGFAEVGGGGAVYSAAVLDGAVKEDPDSFSTSALLRPILQDTMLPTAAYVGGPGEIAYFAQLEPLYQAYGIEMPLIVPRSKFRILEEKTLRILARLGVPADAASGSEDQLLASARVPERAPYTAEELEQTLMANMDRSLDEALSKIESLGEGLDTAVEKTRGTIKGAVGKLREKYQRALLHRDQALVEDVRRLRALLYPNGEPQERVYGVSYFAARYGERNFIERTLSSIVPFDGGVKDLRL